MVESKYFFQTQEVDIIGRIDGAGDTINWVCDGNPSS